MGWSHTVHGKYYDRSQHKTKVIETDGNFAGQSTVTSLVNFLSLFSYIIFILCACVGHLILFALVCIVVCATLRRQHLPALAWNEYHNHMEEMVPFYPLIVLHFLAFPQNSNSIRFCDWLATICRACVYKEPR